MTQIYYPNELKEEVFQYSDNPRSYIMKAAQKDVRFLIHDLDIPNTPESQYFSRFYSGKEFFKGNNNALKRLHKYAFEIFGLRVPPPQPLAIKMLKWPSNQQPYPHSNPDKPKPRYMRIDSFFIIQVWRIRVFCPPLGELQVSLSSPLTPQYPRIIYAEELWSSLAGHRLSVCGLEQFSGRRLSSHPGRFTMDALRILEYVNARGRRAGPVLYKKADGFFRKLDEVYKQLTKKYKRHATQEEVASKMKISLSTLKNRIKDYDIKWPPESD